MGWRCSQRHAFPRQRAIATRWNSYLMEELLDAGGGVQGVDSLGNGLPERPTHAHIYIADMRTKEVSKCP